MTSTRHACCILGIRDKFILFNMDKSIRKCIIGSEGRGKRRPARGDRTMYALLMLGFWGLCLVGVWGLGSMLFRRPAGGRA
jgi:hypothetical protein